jgi:hypothetical protein
MFFRPATEENFSLSSNHIGQSALKTLVSNGLNISATNILRTSENQTIFLSQNIASYSPSESQPLRLSTFWRWRPRLRSGPRPETTTRYFLLQLSGGRGNNKQVANTRGCPRGDQLRRSRCRLRQPLALGGRDQPVAGAEHYEQRASDVLRSASSINQRCLGRWPVVSDLPCSALRHERPS